MPKQIKPTKHLKNNNLTINKQQHPVHYRTVNVQQRTV